MLKKLLIGRVKNLIHFVQAIFQVMVNGYPARYMDVVGVTGTDGKTTTSHILHHLLRDKYKVALISTVAAYFDGDEIDTGLHVTTPDPRVLQPLIKKLYKRGAGMIVLETTSHGLDQHRVLGCNFSTAVLTNVTHEHLDYHGTFEKYRKSKLKLFRGIEVAVLNKDDKNFNFFKQNLNPDIKLVTYSLNKRADFVAKNIKITPRGMKFALFSDKKTYNMKTKLIGRYNISNILASVAVARQKDIKVSEIKKSLQTFSGVKGRMEIIDEGQGFTVLVDFAHTPNALKNTLETLDELKGNSRLIAVFGCAGERDYLKRPIMAKISTNIADVSVFTAEDPRHEDIEDIFDAMEEGVNENKVKRINTNEKIKISKNKKYYAKIPDRDVAIGYAIKNIAKRGDIIVICGKGHERSMAYGNKEYPWSDEEVVIKYLKRKI